ncbi:MAG: hypothetical protein ACRD6N_09625 [Pyrinomonadaceae bacterium]
MPKRSGNSIDTCEGVARYLTNSLHVVVPHGAHGLSGLEGIECLDRLNTEFIEKGSVKGLDASCLKNVKRKSWAFPNER